MPRRAGDSAWSSQAHAAGVSLYTASRMPIHAHGGIKIEKVHISMGYRMKLEIFAACALTVGALVAGFLAAIPW